MTNYEINPSTNPESFITFVFLADGEVCGFAQYPVIAEAMISGLRSGNVSVVEIPTGSPMPSIFSTWDGEQFVTPVNG